jgi:hypothetical protein
MAQVYVPTPLRRVTRGQARVAAEGRTVEEALCAPLREDDEVSIIPAMAGGRR